VEPATPRRHLAVIELDRGYTVSMDERIMACESLIAVCDAVLVLLGPTITSPFAPSPNGHMAAPPAPAPPVPVPPQEEEAEVPDVFPPEPEEEEEDDNPFIFDPDEEEDEELARQRANLTILVTQFLEQQISAEDLEAEVRAWCPLLGRQEMLDAVARGQGLDPGRITPLERPA
jgi:hypothetical protein